VSRTAAGPRPAARRREPGPSAPAILLPLAVIAAVAFGARLAAGGAMLGYDASWSLLWGRDVASGSWPELEAPGAPTPHPLHILVAAPLGPVGSTGADLLLAWSWLSLGALAWLAYRLGTVLFSPWVGVAFAVLLVTRPLLLLETRQAIVDVPFLALVAGAGLCALRGRRTGWQVPVLLALAGLLRPEGWLLALAWLAWAAPAAPARRRLQLGALAVAAPVAWALLDLAATGDPLHSLNVTQGLAEQLDRPRDLDTALRTTPDYLRLVATPVVAWIGLAGALAALMWLPERALPPAAVAGLGLAAFLVLGIAGLPLLTRYLLLPAAILLLFAAVLAAGFTAVFERRRRWLMAGLAALVAIAVSVPSQLDEISRAGRVADLRVAVAEDLEGIVREPQVTAALTRCDERIVVPDDRPRPLVALALERSVATVEVQGDDEEPRAGVSLAYATEAARENFEIGPGPPPGAPPGGRTLAANPSWLATERC
jgi:hypothetical protein